MSCPIGYYILFLKWWNIKVEFFTIKNDLYLIIILHFPRKIGDIEVSISNRGVYVHHFN